MSLPRRAWRGRAGAALVAGVAFFAGLSLDHVARAARRDAGQPYRALDVFADALATIENAYVDPIQEKELVYGAIDGMVARLDAHSQFLRPDAFRALNEETRGEFDGVGIELTIRGGELVVVAPIADAPAARAGIRSGDRILRIDGASSRDMALSEAIRRMKGEAGTTLTLEVAGEPPRATRTVTMTRERVRTRSVEWRVADGERGVVSLRIKAFQERTDEAVGKALDAARAELHGAVGGLVLDLRDDPGGLVGEAVRVADRFLAEGVIVTTEGRGRRPVEVVRARPEGTEPAYPMVVLVNHGTASASEIVAGALQDHARATVVGTQTFGKGSVQGVIDLEDGSGLKLTVARYFTPKHRSIHEVGITPDVVIAEGLPGRDSQLEAAVAHLRAAMLPDPRQAAAPRGTSTQ